MINSNPLTCNIGDREGETKSRADFAGEVNPKMNQYIFDRITCNQFWKDVTGPFCCKYSPGVERARFVGVFGMALVCLRGVTAWKDKPNE